MSDDPGYLDSPPFPPMTWGDYECWEGYVDLSFGEGGFSVTPYDPGASRLPADYQRQAVGFLLSHGEHVFEAVLAALRPYYDEMRPRYLSFLVGEAETRMPKVNSAADLSRLIDLRQVHVNPWTKGGMGYIGLQFGCTWDVEHGLGFMLHRDRVVSVGGADVSFAWCPEEADKL